jgi:hypothetical protein
MAEPAPASNGGKYPHHPLSPTARSSPITVPKKPQTISGPWNVSQLAFPLGSGKFSGNRVNPPQTPATRQAMPTSSNGSRPTRFVPWGVMAFQVRGPIIIPKLF